MAFPLDSQRGNRRRDEDPLLTYAREVEARRESHDQRVERLTGIPPTPRTLEERIARATGQPTQRPETHDERVYRLTGIGEPPPLAKTSPAPKPVRPQPAESVAPRPVPVVAPPPMLAARPVAPLPALAGMQGEQAAPPVLPGFPRPRPTPAPEPVVRDRVRSPATATRINELERTLPRGSDGRLIDSPEMRAAYVAALPPVDQRTPGETALAAMYEGRVTPQEFQANWGDRLGAEIAGDDSQAPVGGRPEHVRPARLDSPMMIQPERMGRYGLDPAETQRRMDAVSTTREAAQNRDADFWESPASRNPAASVEIDVAALLASPESEAAEWAKIPNDRPVSYTLRNPDGSVVQGEGIVSPERLRDTVRRNTDDVRFGTTPGLRQGRGLLNQAAGGLIDLDGQGSEYLAQTAIRHGYGDTDFVRDQLQRSDVQRARGQSEVYRGSVDATFAESPFQAAMEGLGRSTPQMVAAMGAGAIATAAAPEFAAAGLLGAGAVNVPFMAGGELQDAARDPETDERRDITAGQYAAAVASGVVQSAFESAGEVGVLRNSVRAARGLAPVGLEAVEQGAQRGILAAMQHAGAQIPKSMIEEGATEAIQSLVSDVAAGAWDDERGVIDGAALSRAAEQAVMGAVIGGLMTGAPGAGRVGIEGVRDVAGAVQDVRSRRTIGREGAEAFDANLDAFDTAMQADPALQDRVAGAGGRVEQAQAYPGMGRGATTPEQVPAEPMRGFDATAPVPFGEWLRSSPERVYRAQNGERDVLASEYEAAVKSGRDLSAPYVPPVEHVMGDRVFDARTPEAVTAAVDEFERTVGRPFTGEDISAATFREEALGRPLNVGPMLAPESVPGAAPETNTTEVQPAPVSLPAGASAESNPATSTPAESVPAAQETPPAQAVPEVPASVAPAAMTPEEQADVAQVRADAADPDSDLTQEEAEQYAEHVQQQAQAREDAARDAEREAARAVKAERAAAVRARLQAAGSLPAPAPQPAQLTPEERAARVKRAEMRRAEMREWESTAAFPSTPPVLSIPEPVQLTPAEQAEIDDARDAAADPDIDFTDGQADEAVRAVLDTAQARIQDAASPAGASGVGQAITDAAQTYPVPEVQPSIPRAADVPAATLPGVSVPQPAQDPVARLVATAPPDTRQRWDRAFNAAQAADEDGRAPVERAEGIALTVAAGESPTVSDAEYAGLLVHAARLSEQLDGVEQQAADMIERGDTEPAAVLRRQASEVLARLDRTAQAADRLAPVLSSPFHARQVRPEAATFTGEAVLRRATVEKGERLTTDERAGIDTALAQLRDAEAAVDALESAATAQADETAAEKAQRAIDRERQRREQHEATTEAARDGAARREKRRAGILAAREQIKGDLRALGLRVNDVTGLTVEGGYAFARLAINYAQSAALTLEEIVARVQEDLPELSAAEIVAALANPKSPQRSTTSREIEQARVERARAQKAVRAAVHALRPRNRFEWVGELLGAPRALKATGDMSAVFRQGAVLIARRPAAASRAFAQALQAAFSEFHAERIDQMIREDPRQFAREAAGLYLAPVGEGADAVGLTGREEAFMSRILERIPVLGPVMRGSERHYTSFLNLMRVSAFDGFAGSHLDATPEQLQAWAQYVNAASGRGNLGDFNGASATLAQAFFSPRFMVSRFQVPLALIKPSTPAAVRMEIAKDLAAFVGLGLSTLALASLALDDDEGMVGVDPRDSDFGKIVIGNLRIDVWGGEQQVARFLSRAALTVTDNAGLTSPPAGRRGDDVYKLAAQFLTYKMSPSVTVPVELLTGRNVFGQPVPFKESASEALLPLGVSGTAEAYAAGRTPDEGRAYAASAFLLNFFGVGASAYDAPLRSVATQTVLRRAGYTPTAGRAERDAFEAEFARAIEDDLRTLHAMEPAALKKRLRRMAETARRHSPRREDEDDAEED